MWGILIPLLVGVAVGYFVKGKQDKSRLFWIGAVWAVIIAALLAIVGWSTGTNPATAGESVGFWAIFWSFLVSIGAFLIGVWIGDLIEGRSGRRALPPSNPRI